MYVNHVCALKFAEDSQTTSYDTGYQSLQHILELNISEGIIIVAEAEVI